MSWAIHHRESERLAGEAEAAIRLGQRGLAHELFRQSARSEERALAVVGTDKPRTLGVTAVSAAALWYHAGELQEAARVAHSASTLVGLPAFAATELRMLLQAIWNDAAQKEAGLSFVPGSSPYRHGGWDHAGHVVAEMNEFETIHIKADHRLTPTAWIMCPTATGFVLKFSWWAWLMIKLGVRRHE